MNATPAKYGTGANLIHPFFERKREWSIVKDTILEAYITCYLKTIQGRGRPIIIVDAFAGPGHFGDGSDGSPLIICKAIEKAPRRGVGIACLFADSHGPHREALQTCLSHFIDQGLAERPAADFTDVLSRALDVGNNSTLFFYLDPYGIKDLEFDVVKQIYDRDPTQSTEVLINFSFKTFMRMSGNWSQNDSASTVANKVKHAKVDTVSRVMGGDYWVDIVTDPTIDKIQREDAVVAAYLERVREFFPYTYSIPVKELDEPGSAVPSDDLAKYHLIFGTRSARAVVYMNDVALNALAPYFNQFTDGLLFDFTPPRYEREPVDEVKSAIVRAVDERPMTRVQIYEAVIPSFFLERPKKEYRAIIDEMTFRENRLHPDRSTMKRKTQLNDKTLLSRTPWPTSEAM